MLKNRVKKGDIGYLAYRKKQVLLQTLLMFAISISIFVCGYLYRGTKANAMTIVAVLGLLPASKSLVSLIMYLRTPKYDAAYFQKLQSALHSAKPLCELYFTTYQKSYPVNFILCTKDTIVGFTQFEKVQENDLEKHIHDILNQNGHQDITVKIFKDYAKFEARAVQLDAQKQSENLGQLMLDICL